MVQMLQFGFLRTDAAVWDVSAQDRHDCIAAVTLLKYCCQIVKLSVAADACQQILASATEDPMPHPVLYSCPHKESAAKDSQYGGGPSSEGVGSPSNGDWPLKDLHCCDRAGCHYDKTHF
jgi:hypothetical protein